MLNSTEPFVPLGAHRVQVDGDSVYIVANGLFTMADMHETLALFARVKAQHGQLFAVYDAREATGIEPEARKYAAEQPKSNKPADLQIVITRSFALRILLTMVLRAQRLLRNRIIVMYFVETPEEARALLHTERARIRREKSQSPGASMSL